MEALKKIKKKIKKVSHPPTGRKLTLVWSYASLQLPILVDEFVKFQRFAAGGFGEIGAL